MDVWVVDVIEISIAPAMIMVSLQPESRDHLLSRQACINCRMSHVPASTAGLKVEEIGVIGWSAP